MLPIRTLTVKEKKPKRKMKPGAGKTKGSGFERHIADSLSLWLSHGERKDLVTRSTNSGARFTSSVKFRGEEVGPPGDIMSVHPITHKFCSTFVVECKFWKDLNMIAFLQGRGELYGYLEKTASQAHQLGMSWMMIVKQNNNSICLIMPFTLKIYELAGLANIRCHTLFSGTMLMFEYIAFTENITPEELLNDNTANTATVAG